MLADAQQSCYVHQHMRNHKSSSTAQACGAQVASKVVNQVSGQAQYQQIKLALDVHAASVVVARMVDGAKPQPLQSFKPAAFLDEAVRQLTRELEVQAPKLLPKGLGRLTYQAVETEVADWDRFENRRQVGSYAGLCGGVSASGQRLGRSEHYQSGQPAAAHRPGGVGLASAAL